MEIIIKTDYKTIGAYQINKLEEKIEEVLGDEFALTNESVLVFGRYNEEEIDEYGEDEF